MPARPAPPPSQEGLYAPSASPSIDDNYSQPRRFYDNESENNIEYLRRDTYNSEGPNTFNDPERYYDQHNTYDLYGQPSPFFHHHR